MKNFWHTFGTIGLTIAVAAVPQLRDAVAAKPIVATVLGGVWAVLGGLVQPSVTQPK